MTNVQNQVIREKIVFSTNGAKTIGILPAKHYINGPRHRLYTSHKH